MYALSASAGLGAAYYVARAVFPPSPKEGCVSADAFVPMRIGSMRRIGTDLCEATLDLAPEAAIALGASPPPGSLCVYVKDDRQQVARAYTPIQSWKDLPTDRALRLLFRIYEDGVVTPWMAAKAPGDLLEIRGPILTWPYTPNAHKEIGMVAGGTGVAVMYQILQVALANPTDTTRFRLLYASREGGDGLALGPEIRRMAAEHPDRLEVRYVIASPPPDMDETTCTMADRVESRHLASWIPPPGSGSLVLVSGPDPMMKAVCGERASVEYQGPVRGMLAKMGYAKEEVWKF